MCFGSGRVRRRQIWSLFTVSSCAKWTQAQLARMQLYLFFAVIWCASWVQAQPAAAHAAAEHLLLSIASKVEQKRICGEDFRRLAKIVSTNQRKVSFQPNARRRQLKGFILPPSNSKRFTAGERFSLAVGLDV